MLHVTFADGTTALFDSDERVTLCEWLSEDGEYFAGDFDCSALGIYDGAYVLNRSCPDARATPLSTAPVSCTRLL